MDMIPQTPFERLAPLRNDRTRRLGTFQNWPVNCPINPTELCDDQFYYTGLDDKVQCTYCGGILSDWDFGDVVHLEHERHFPDCPWIRQCRTQPGLFSNNPNAGCNPVAQIPNPSMTGFNFSHRAPDGSNFSSTYTVSDHANDRPGVNRPKYPEFSMEMTRLQSYKGWSMQIKQRPDILSKAGFFYMGQGDKCKCFYCGGILYDWEPDDDIWVEHAKWFPECPFLKLTKGDNFINEIQRQMNAMQIEETSGPSQSTPQASASEGTTVPKTVDDSQLPTSSGSKPPASSAAVSKKDVNTFTSVNSLEEKEQKDIKAIIEENESLKKQKECKICMSEDASTVFLPCGHLVCCPGCAVSVKTCPMCRADIEKVVRVYY